MKAISLVLIRVLKIK